MINTVVKKIGDISESLGSLLYSSEGSGGAVSAESCSSVNGASSSEETRTESKPSIVVPPPPALVEELLCFLVVLETSSNLLKVKRTDLGHIELLSANFSVLSLQTSDLQDEMELKCKIIDNNNKIGQYLASLKQVFVFFIGFCVFCLICKYAIDNRILQIILQANASAIEKKLQEEAKSAEQCTKVSQDDGELLAAACKSIIEVITYTLDVLHSALNFFVVGGRGEKLSNEFS